jgi:hypothetical protein
MYQLVGSRCNNKGLCWKDKDNEFVDNPSSNQIHPKKHKKCVFSCQYVFLIVHEKALGWTLCLIGKVTLHPYITKCVWEKGEVVCPKMGFY